MKGRLFYRLKQAQLLEQINRNLPNELVTGSIKRYIEPFIGGGSVFLHIAQSYKVEEFFIFDINHELVLAYKTIQTNVEELIESLSGIQLEYMALNEAERKNYFSQIKLKFNSQRQYINFQNYNDEWIDRTAQIIFLNRTCFNGLWRVNLKGEFNVPVGRYKNPTICDSDNLRAVSRILQTATIQHGDFITCEPFVNNRTLVYFDPPYKPISKTANFTSYSQTAFNDFEQLRLRDFFRLLDSKGAKLILSNSDPQNEDPNDDFFETAYQGYKIAKVKATRSINSNAAKRGYINELLIMNY